MSKEKQIEEMRNILNRRCDMVTMAECAVTDCLHCTAKHLYEAGYRKQSEIAKEIFEQIDIITMKYLDDKDYTAGEMVYDLDNFKYEYMKGGEG